MSSYILPTLKTSIAVFILCYTCNYFSRQNILQSARRKSLEDKLVEKFSKAGYMFEFESIQRIAFGSIFMSFIFGLLVSQIAAMIFPLIVVAVANFYLEVRAKSIQESLGRINDEVCFSLARNLRAGHSLEAGIYAASNEFEHSKVIRLIVRELNGGLPLVAAIKKLSTSENADLDAAEKTLCATISLAQEMGGNSARIFERIGDNFHQSYELGEDTNSALAQVRMSVYVIGILPIVMFVFSFMLGSNSAMFLFTNPIGWFCLITGSFLEIAGILWMKKMVDGGVKVWNF